MKVKRGTKRAHRRSDLVTFHAKQCSLREEAPDNRLVGDKPGDPLPEYFLRHLKERKGRKGAV